MLEALFVYTKRWVGVQCAKDMPYGGGQDGVVILFVYMCKLQNVCNNNNITNSYADAFETMS